MKPLAEEQGIGIAWVENCESISQLLLTVHGTQIGLLRDAEKLTTPSPEKGHLQLFATRYEIFICLAVT
jgi:hypothetical protein